MFMVFGMIGLFVGAMVLAIVFDPVDQNDMCRFYDLSKRR